MTRENFFLLFFLVEGSSFHRAGKFSRCVISHASLDGPSSHDGETFYPYQPRWKLRMSTWRETKAKQKTRCHHGEAERGERGKIKYTTVKWSGEGKKPRKVFSCGFIVKRGRRGEKNEMWCTTGYENSHHRRLYTHRTCSQHSRYVRASLLRWLFEREVWACRVMVLQDVWVGGEVGSGTSWQHSRSVFVLSKIRFLMLLSDNYAIHLTKSFHKNNFQAMLT